MSDNERKARALGCTFLAIGLAVLGGWLLQMLALAVSLR